MSEPFIAEVMIFAGNFNPRGWAFCDGQLLPIAQNTALFSLVGTTYGGDGRVTLALPNLQGRATMHPGRGPGLTARRLGETGGATTVTLTTQTMAHHNHPVGVTPDPGDVTTPSNNASLARSSGGPAYLQNAAGMGNMATQTLPTQVGQGQPHDNLQPYLVLSFIIALVGVYPQRS